MTVKRVAVIGAGIVGVATALWARRAGHEVALIDRDGPASGTSYGNAGILAAAAVDQANLPGLARQVPRMLLDPNEPVFLKWRSLPRLAPWLLRHLAHARPAAAEARARALAPLLTDSLEQHQALAEGTPAARYIVPTEFLYLYRDRVHFDANATMWALRRNQGIAWSEEDSATLARTDPGFGPAVGFAARVPNHGYITDPGAYVRALATAFERDGGRLLRGTATAIARSGGTVTGVRLGGETLDADTVILCTGAWSAPLAKDLGLTLPLTTERGYHMELFGASITPRRPAMISSGAFVATPMEGRLRLAGIAEFGDLESAPSRAPFRLLERGIRRVLPGITWEESREWMGHRPVLVDSTPAIGPVPEVSGAYLGLGHDHVGLTGGAKTGRILAQLISDQRPNLDLSPYAPGRFG
ncbi:NAD(P)/FAD-dependent oxidoreductase [Litorisediminicola beolgyonensis]|uniref:NAD(P)/FAD-dependent oxidoreductase n=1 Tax=Litorisediminicola beolgyonensis TaxID=1173614 RepID=A0ABW3ZMH2_9RHOB